MADTCSPSSFVPPQPLKAIMSSKQAFDPRRFGADPDVSMTPQRALFCAIQLGALCMALNKLDGCAP